jgi:DNA-binding NtrC family response regulator
MVSTIIIADDAGISSSLAEILAAHEHIVTPVTDGAAGLRMLTETMFDLVITDIQAGALSGLDIISRGRVRSPGTRFLAIVGGDKLPVASQAVPAAQKFGPDGMLLKPFKEADLLAVVAELLAESRAFG